MDLSMTLEEHHNANWTCPINFGRKTRAAIYWEGRMQTTAMPIPWFQSSYWGNPWSTVSNAALKSSSTRRVTRWESKFIRMSFCTFKSAVSVLWHLRYADWNGGYKPCDVKCACVWSKTARSVNFEMYCKLLTNSSDELLMNLSAK